MADYLEGYGERDQRRARVIRWLLVAVLILFVSGTAVYFGFRDYPQQRRVRNFVDRLKVKDYRGAYELWGCTDQTPCPQYPFEEFLKDWGPQSNYAAADRAEFAGKKSCDEGIISFIRFPDQPQVLLWVDRRTESLSFAPWTLKAVPPGFKGAFQEWMWNVTRNCKPLIQP
jgi:hypothetical protein